MSSRVYTLVVAEYVVRGLGKRWRKVGRRRRGMDVVVVRGGVRGGQTRDCAASICDACDADNVYDARTKS